eukprot:362713-Chlamydomonas_euryale.AAC.9
MDSPNGAACQWTAQTAPPGRFGPYVQWCITAWIQRFGREWRIGGGGCKRRERFRAREQLVALPSHFAPAPLALHSKRDKSAKRRRRRYRNGLALSSAGADAGGPDEPLLCATRSSLPFARTAAPVACRRALTMRRKERSSSASESRSTLPRVAASSAAASLPALLLSPLPLALPAQHPATTLGRCRRCNAASVGVAGRACIAPCNAGTGSRRRRRGGLLQLAAQDGTAAAVARV